VSRILFIEPFYGGSHRAFADGLRDHSTHTVELLTLPEGEWRSRMRRGAIELARLSDSLAGDYDAIVATDMLDIGQFLGLTRPRFAATPVLYYLHENQFTYPRLKGTKLNSWFGQVNYMSALVADAVAFNSGFHRDDFLGALRKLAAQPANWLDEATIESLAGKSVVLPIGLDLKRLDQYHERRSHRPLLLWNHRWEFDKAPATFARAIAAVAEQGVEFDLALAGDPGPNPHPAFSEIRTVLGERVVQFGRVESAEAYAKLLWRSHVAVSTSRQEFFGISMVEAMYAECVPIAPNALNYPDIVPREHHDTCLFDDEQGLVAKLTAALRATPDGQPFRANAARWDWADVEPQWDAALKGLVDGRLLQQ
jgi:glycosyltransferase involved in cell wall biosynthesis